MDADRAWRSGTGRGVMAEAVVEVPGPLLPDFRSARPWAGVHAAVRRGLSSGRRRPADARDRGSGGGCRRDATTAFGASIIGICGTAIASWPPCSRRRGFDVRGPIKGLSADERFPRVGRDRGRKRYAAEHITSDIDFVVVGNAISRRNPGLEEVLDGRFARVASEAIGRIFSGRAVHRHRRHPGRRRRRRRRDGARRTAGSTPACWWAASR